ncbi:Zinc transporter 2 [Trichinella pseudospiralis]|uniref:Zinc transporter 2 n=1 Tax=Trichinella pseudospiralis TaxID=6337 RepID=A0A0V1I9H0_TRIPS|nr:Zinc transporter 2 [Trichinella pseudospiralis]
MVDNYSFEQEKVPIYRQSAALKFKRIFCWQFGYHDRRGSFAYRFGKLSDFIILNVRRLEASNQTDELRLAQSRMASVLHCLGGHGHSHNLSSSANHLKSNVKESKNINVRAAFIHVLGDFCQSVGVLAAAFVIYYKPDLTIVDPICTFIFSVLVLITTVNIVKDVLNVLMEGSPRSISFNEVFSTLRSIEGVEKVHDLRIWSLTMDKIALSVHLAVNSDCNTQELLKNATSTLRQRYNVYESTVQIERFSNDMVQCLRCEPPNL